MGQPDARVLLEEFIESRSLALNTRKTYRGSVLKFISWSENAGVGVIAIAPADIEQFIESMRSMSESTRDVHVRAVRLYFDYLVSVGLIVANPAKSFGRGKITRAIRDVLSVDQLWEMLSAAESVQDRVIVGLLGLCGVRIGEMLEARVDDLRHRDGIMTLQLSQRLGPHEFDYVVIPDLLASDLKTSVEGRQSGLLLRPGSRGGGRPTSKTVRLAVDMTSAHLQLPFRVVPATLSMTLRAVAIERGFSYASVVRSVSEVEPRRLAAWVRRIDLDLKEHASYELGQLVDRSRDRDDLCFYQAERILLDRLQAPAASLILSAATLERVLREAFSAIEPVVKKSPNLRFFAERLYLERVVSLQQRNVITGIFDLRNLAAHGHFEDIDKRDAGWVLEQSRALVSSLGTGSRGKASMSS